MVKYWLMKSEPEVYSIDNLKQDGFSSWEGVRNFQARNMIRDEMAEGDLVLFYHSNAKPPGIAGVCRICRAAHPDPTAFDPKSPYFDPKSSPDDPTWFMVEVEYVEKFPTFISLNDLRNTPELKDLKVLQKGSRLSIQPVDPKHFKIVCSIGRQ